MIKKIKIIPAVLAKNGTDFKKRWQKIAPYFKYVQIDIMDGYLVPIKNNIRPSCVRPLAQNHRLEIHLMVKGVSARILPWLKLKNVRQIIWHYEAESDERSQICLAQYLHQKKVKVGLAINPETPVNKIKKIVKYFDAVQIMGVIPGREKQAFQKSVLTKIKSLRRLYPRLNIIVDGGVNEKTALTIKKAGASALAIGSYLQKSADIPQAIKKLNL
ncbi:MAG: hypothetical protein C3F02_04330 [Parcubacteria group bacterium]|nr:MAG: hypothetical protein C3F02_04330 [Parcubacteria group bacterium]